MSERKLSLQLPPECRSNTSIYKELSSRFDDIVPAELSGDLEILKNLGTKMPGFVEEDAFARIYSFLVSKCREGAVDFNDFSDWFYCVINYYMRFQICGFGHEWYPAELFFAIKYFEEVFNLAVELKGDEGPAACRCKFESGKVMSAAYGFNWALKEYTEARKIFYARGIFDERLYNDLIFEELRAYIKEGKFKIAEELLAEAYELSVKLYGEESFMTARIEGQKAMIKYWSLATREFDEKMEYFTGAAAKMMKYCSADSDTFLLAEQYYLMFKMELNYGDFENSLECLKFAEKVIAGSLGQYSEAMINLMKASEMAEAGCAKSCDEKDIVKFFLLKCVLCNCCCVEVFDESVKIFTERLETCGCDKITLNFAVMAGVAAYKKSDIERTKEYFTRAGEIFNTLEIPENDKYSYKWIESKIAMFRAPKEVAADGC